MSVLSRLRRWLLKLLGGKDMRGGYTTAGHIDAALDACGFVGIRVEGGADFRRVFGFDPNVIQEVFSGAVGTPGMYVLEAQMGLGKTEAALWAAYGLLSTGAASGMYFALPTQATANQMYKRVSDFLSVVTDKYAHSVAKLTHGSAGILQDFGSEGGPGGSWYDSSKNALLAPFGVGTIDQALMACLNVRFSGVRAFAMAGKVLIVDEVHSYDAYTGTVLKSLIDFVLGGGGSVILLSATLTNQAVTMLTGVVPSTDAYPRITAKLSIPVLLGTPDKMVEVRYGIGMDDALKGALRDAGRGAQVLFIVNTVADSMEVYAHCVRVLGGSRVGLLHSRFTAGDRQKNEAHWCKLYGKGGDRSVGRILIGTQVLEQSLDLDADVMYTFLAPTDMLFQRMGRLQRHASNVRPVGFETPILYVITPTGLDNYVETATDIEEKPLRKILGGTGWVYDLHTLVKTHEVWKGLGSIAIPGGMRKVLEDTYK